MSDNVLLDWYRFCAESGLAEEQWMLGDFYYNGYDV